MAEETLLRALYEQHASLEEMAGELRRSQYAVYCRMERMELYGDGAEDGYPVRDGASLSPEEIEQTHRQE